MRSAQCQASIKVINDLRHNARPVDGVNRNQLATFRQERLITEAGFDHVLTIVKVTFKRNVKYVRRKYSSHLATLYIGHAIVRVHDENIDVVTAAATFNCG